MRNMLKKDLGRGSKSEKGFTLIELLVVVGIIVALAEATPVPLPQSGTRFSPQLTR